MIFLSGLCEAPLDPSPSIRERLPASVLQSSSNTERNAWLSERMNANQPGDRKANTYGDLLLEVALVALAPVLLDALPPLVSAVPPSRCCCRRRRRARRARRNAYRQAAGRAWEPKTLSWSAVLGCRMSPRGITHQYESDGRQQIECAEWGVERQVR